MTAPALSPVTLVYDEKGTGDPIVFIAGLNDSRQGWELTVPAFEDYHCITIDNRDVGDSPRMSASYTRTEMVRDVVDVLDRARISAAHIVGHSGGGLIAQDLSLDYPERVRSLVLVCTFCEVDSWIAGEVSVWKRLALSPDKDDLTRGAILSWIGASTINEMGYEAVVEMLQPLVDDQPRDAFVRQVDGMTSDPAPRRRLHEIDKPTLVVWANEDHGVLHHHAQQLVDGIAGARYVEIARSGHAPQLEQPEQFNAALLEFLASVG